MYNRLSADMLSMELKDESGKIWNRMVMLPSAFSTGSIGYKGNGRITDPYDSSKEFTISINVVLIGSKQKAQKERGEVLPEEEEEEKE